MNKKLAIGLALSLLTGWLYFAGPGQLAATVWAGGADLETKAENANTVKVGNFTLQLTGSELTYQSSKKSGRFDFGFSSQCQFSRDQKGQIRIVQTGKTKTVLVESSIKAASGESGTRLRAIVISTRDIRLSQSTQTVAQSLPAVWDEKMYHVLAAKTVPIPVKK